MTRALLRLAAVLMVMLAAAAHGAAPANAISSDIAQAVADPARPAADRARDTDRKPTECVTFAGLKRGDRVADLIPGGGYFTRIFSATVGPQGHVYAIAPPRRPNAPADCPGTRCSRAGHRRRPSLCQRERERPAGHAAGACRLARPGLDLAELSRHPQRAGCGSQRLQQVGVRRLEAGRRLHRARSRRRTGRRISRYEDPPSHRCGCGEVRGTRGGIRIRWRERCRQERRGQSHAGGLSIRRCTTRPIGFC